MEVIGLHDWWNKTKLLVERCVECKIYGTMEHFPTGRMEIGEVVKLVGIGV